jgi:hypothetical protein
MGLGIKEEGFRQTERVSDVSDVSGPEVGHKRGRCCFARANHWSLD